MAIGDSIKNYATGFFSGTGGLITVLVYVILFAVVGGIIAYFLITMLKYNKKIIIMENISGIGFRQTGKDRARTIKIADDGSEVLYLRRRKLFKGAYGKRTGKNQYTFAIGKDGYWYNVDNGDLDYSLSQLKMTPVDRDMRYAHEGIRKNVTLRFEKKNWFKENIGMIFGIAAIVIVLLFMWLLADKYFTIFGSADATLKASEQVMEKANTIMSTLDNICSGGKGFVPA